MKLHVLRKRLGQYGRPYTRVERQGKHKRGWRIWFPEASRDVPRGRAVRLGIVDSN